MSAVAFKCPEGVPMKLPELRNVFGGQKGSARRSLWLWSVGSARCIFVSSICRQLVMFAPAHSHHTQRISFQRTQRLRGAHFWFIHVMQLRADGRNARESLYNSQRAVSQLCVFILALLTPPAERRKYGPGALAQRAIIHILYIFDHTHTLTHS